MSQIFANELFGIGLSLLAYYIGYRIQKATKIQWMNPLLIAIILVILVLKLCGISIEHYEQGGNVISLFLAPATACLAYSIYDQLELLKKNVVPILAGCLAGAVTSMGSIYLLCKFFKVDHTLMLSLLPKSVTTPIALGISEQLGGIQAVTMVGVLIAGIGGAIFCPMVAKLLRIKNPVAVGVGLGSASHAIGTSKAVELGEIQGAMSGISIGVSGILTVVLAIFL